MVAYSFNKAFVPQVTNRVKRQTVRAVRKRHARPGEPVQLYTAMRTRHCRKLVTPDPICIGVDDIRIVTGAAALPRIDAIEINGIPLDGDEIETFAADDGFDLWWFQPRGGREWRPEITASVLMAHWWRHVHPEEAFQGVVIRWRFEDEADGQ